MIRRPFAALAAMLAPLLPMLREPQMPPASGLGLRHHEPTGNRSTRGPGRRRAGRRVPRVGGIAHPPTARLRACGHWGRR